MRRHFGTVVAVLMTASLTTGGVAVAQVIADYARNSDKVDNFHAVGAGTSTNGRKGRLVATSAQTGRLPNNIVAKPPDADKLDGRNSTDFDDARTLDGRDSPDFDDAQLLDGRDSTDFDDAQTLDGIDSSGFLAAAGTAADAQLLDGRDSTDFDDAQTLDGIDSSDLARSYCELAVDDPTAYPMTPCRSSMTLENAQGDQIAQLTAITIGADGLPIVAARNETDAAIEVAHCANVACSVATLTTLEAPDGDSIGAFLGLDIAIGTDGLAIISAWNGTEQALQVIHCSNVLCTAATHTTLESGNEDIGSYASVAIGADGLPIVSSFNQTDAALQVTHCSNVACTSATHVTLENGQNDGLGVQSRIEIGSDGRPFVASYNGSDQAIEVAHCADVTCSTAQMTTFENGQNDVMGQHLDLAIGTDGLPLAVAYNQTDAAFEVLHCSSVACLAGTMTTLENGLGQDVGREPSVVIGADGRPVLAAKNSAFVIAIEIMRCASVDCATAVSFTFKHPTPNIYGGQGSSGALGVDGVPIFSWINTSAAALEVLHLVPPG